jgi:hypothetical protein
MTKKIAHIILFSLFALFVANYVVIQVEHLKKDTTTYSIQEQVEEDLNEGDYFLNVAFFMFQPLIKNIFLYSTNLEGSKTVLHTTTKGFSPHGFHTEAYLDLCVFRI